jgi:hypothetical protein
MSKIFVDQVDPKTGTSLTLGTSGDTVNIPSGVTLANAGTVTGLPASAISSGTIATARLGSGTASSSTFLRGDQTYAAAGGGKIGQVVYAALASTFSTTSGTASDIGLSASITPSATSSYILAILNTQVQVCGNSTSTSPHGDMIIYDTTNTAIKLQVQCTMNLPANTNCWSGTQTLMQYWTPGSTSAQSIKIQGAAQAGRFQMWHEVASSKGSATQLYLLEILA